MTNSEDDGHPRGILTDADREFLSGERELSEGAARNARQRIRERTRVAIDDFELLWGCLSERDFEQIFHPEEAELRRSIRSSSQYALAFFLLGLWTNRDPHEGRLESAIEQAAFANDWVAAAEVTMEYEDAPSGDLLLAKIKQKEQRIIELIERLDQEGISTSRQVELENELEREAAFRYYLFEKGLVDSTVDPDELASLTLHGEETEWKAEDVREFREANDESPFVREFLPTIVDQERVWKES
jgi:hypothetical protein